jgi:Holliday junction resolvase
MPRYNKGANAERELIKDLDKLGFAVLRVAGSGVNPLPCPDVVALKNGKIIAFECKAKKGDYLSITHEQMEEEIGWSKKAGALFLIAWKVPRKGWLFFRSENFRKKAKSYMIKLDEAKEVSIDILDL